MTGLLLVDKEPDWTSHDVVAKLRGTLRERRIGHAGTLDPLATGLLVVLCGRATRACEFAEADEKEYVAALRCGLTTDTQDITGRVLTRSGALPGEAQLLSALPRFTGAIEQLPPMYSAIKIGGQKLYDVARRGGEVERQPRGVTVHALELLGREGEDFLLRIRCSKGTYIRTLCHDLGQALGCGGVMAALRRTRCGPFRVENAQRVGEITPACLLPLESLFSSRPALSLTPEQERRCRCGNDFPCTAVEGEYRFLGAQDAFLALGSVRNGRAAAIKSFFEV